MHFVLGEEAAFFDRADYVSGPRSNDVARWFDEQQTASADRLPNPGLFVGSESVHLPFDAQIEAEFELALANDATRVLAIDSSGSQERGHERGGPGSARLFHRYVPQWPDRAPRMGGSDSMSLSTGAAPPARAVQTDRVRSGRCSLLNERGVARAPSAIEAPRPGMDGSWQGARCQPGTLSRAPLAGLQIGGSV